jgi:hypothetical protein
MGSQINNEMGVFEFNRIYTFQTRRRNHACKKEKNSYSAEKRASLNLRHTGESAQYIAERHEVQEEAEQPGNLRERYPARAKQAMRLRRTA